MRRRRAREGLAYSAGVVLACVGLGALLLALRAGGSEVGWAFQLQEPLVVAALLLLAVGAHRQFPRGVRIRRAWLCQCGFDQGRLCHRPARRLRRHPLHRPVHGRRDGRGAAVAGGAGLALFAALGLGIALPFLAIAFVPALRRMLPRPGPWMVTFRRWMALPMGLTALALLWLASRVGGMYFAGVWLGVLAALVGAAADPDRAKAARRAGAEAGLCRDAELLIALAAAATSAHRQPARSQPRRACSRAAFLAKPRWPRPALRASRCSSISPPTGA